MEIKFKYGIGDKVWVWLDGQATKVTVSERLYRDNNYATEVTLQYGLCLSGTRQGSRSEYDIFPTREALFESFMSGLSVGRKVKLWDNREDAPEDCMIANELTLWSDGSLLIDDSNGFEEVVPYNAMKALYGHLAKLFGEEDGN